VWEHFSYNRQEFDGFLASKLPEMGQVPKPKIKSELCISAWHFIAASLALALSVISYQLPVFWSLRLVLFTVQVAARIRKS
jgi:hypothetical protein